MEIFLVILKFLSLILGAILTSVSFYCLGFNELSFQQSIFNLGHIILGCTMLLLVIPNR